jgi:hypothetical protein
MNNNWHSLATGVPPSSYSKDGRFVMFITDNNAQASIRLRTSSTLNAGGYLSIALRPLQTTTDNRSQVLLPINSDGTIQYLATEALTGLAVLLDGSWVEG